MRKFLKKIFGNTHRSVEKALRESTSLNARLKKALALYLEELEAERGCLILELPDKPSEFIHVGPQELEEQFPFSRAVVDTVLDEGRGIYSYDSHEEFESDSESLNSQGARSFVCTPIIKEGSNIGVIYLDNPTADGLFSQENLDDLEKFAELIAQAQVDS